MERMIPLLEGDRRRGDILCRNEGCYLTFKVNAPLWGSGVKKVWLIGDTGGKLLLGTLMPDGQRLTLQRRLSHSTLRCCGMSSPVSGMIDPPGPQIEDGWYSLDTLELSDPYLTAEVKQAHRGSWRREKDTLLLRFPWQVGQAVPVTSLFCLGRPENGWWTIELKESLLP